VQKIRVVRKEKYEPVSNADEAPFRASDVPSFRGKPVLRLGSSNVDVAGRFCPLTALDRPSPAVVVATTIVLIHLPTHGGDSDVILSITVTADILEMFDLISVSAC